uniref:Uncharacterized protein n=1 Tax=Opuntia streptacantha TaxID=393608 RepID=A0A7C9DW95_OPUST
MAANSLIWCCCNGLFENSIYLRERSRRFTSVRPHARQIDTALVDHAVVNDNLGPTSTTTAVKPSIFSLSKKLSVPRFSGSYVSPKSHFSTGSFSLESSAPNPILKHCSVRKPTISFDIFV